MLFSGIHPNHNGMRFFAGKHRVKHPENHGASVKYFCWLIPFGLWMFFTIHLQAQIQPQERRRWDEPVNITTLNTDRDEFAPAWSPLEKLLYFNSTADGYSKFYTARYEPPRDQKRDAKPVFSNRDLVRTTLNAPRNNQSFVTFAKDGSVYFSTFRLTKTRPLLNIYQAARRNGSLWEQPEAVAALNTDDFNAHPTLSPSGKTIVFASNRAGGRGGTDLWIASKDASGEWQTPVNMGEILNSPEDEISPFFASEDSLYFASDGFGGKGGFEIFLSLRTASKWQSPVPVVELNSEYDDFDLTLLPDKLCVFSSNRPGGRGGLDLYSSRLINLSLASSALEYKIAPQTTFLTVEEFSTTEFLPVLPCIFFGENVSTLSPESHQLSRDEMMNYSTAAARPDPLGIYAELLNVIGKRLRDYEDAALIITPYIPESPNPKQLEVAKARAEAVRKYLTTAWGIDRSRLISGTPKNIAEMLPVSVVTGSTSQHSPLRTTILGTNERSRCVEFTCNDPRILAPVQIGGVNPQTKQQKLEVYLDVRPRGFLRSWRFAALAGVSDTVLTTEGITLPYTVTMQLQSEILGRLSNELRLQLSGVDSLNRAGKEEVMVNVYKISLDEKRRQKEPTHVIERHRLLLLDESQAELLPEQQEYLKSIATSLTPQSVITVSGYGTVEVRKGKNNIESQMSQIERFMGFVAETFKRATQGITVKTELLGDNDALAAATPQERLYARSVFITIERTLPPQEKR